MLTRVVLACLCLTPIVVPSTAAAARPAAARCTIVGTPGDDHILGTVGRDVICGRGGDDTIDASRGADVVRGGAGDDRINGGQGADRLIGGPGDDVINGSNGRDVLVGGPGDDDLIDGRASPGPGHDYCEDASRRACAGDDTGPPTIRSVSLSESSVDVSTSSRTVTIRTHVTDEVGVGGIYLRLVGHGGSLGLPAGSLYEARADLVRGNVRDGVWRTRILVPRYQMAGDYRVEVRVEPRVGDPEVHTLEQHLAVSSSPSDQQAPVLVAMTGPTPGAHLAKSYHPRISVRITDDRTGVELVWLCYRGVDQDPARCTQGELASGTERDGSWGGRMELADVALGPGTFDIFIVDHAGRSSRWWGPSGWEQIQLPGVEWPDDHPIPGGYGDFVVD